MRKSSLEEEKQPCDHAVPDPEYVSRTRRKRFVKGKHYVWVNCSKCNVVFLGVFTQKAEEAEPTA